MWWSPSGIASANFGDSAPNLIGASAGAFALPLQLNALSPKSVTEIRAAVALFEKFGFTAYGSETRALKTDVTPTNC